MVRNTLDRILNWTVEDVVRWLRKCGFGKYEATFRSNDINGKHLLELGKEDLQNDLKITSLGQRKDILLEIEKLKKGTDGNSSLELIYLVAKGAFGSVWKATWEGREWFAETV